MPRAIIVIVLMALVMFGAFTMLPGCAAASPRTDRDVAPIYQSATGHARSLIADPALVREHHAETQAGVNPPWYHNRNDQRAAVWAGYRAPALSSAYTRTIDRQQTTSSGRVFDTYSQITYRTRVVDGIE